MKLGIVTVFDGRPGRTMRDLTAVAQHAEAAGLDSMLFPEHVVFFADYESTYPYGEVAFGKRPGAFDPLFACAVAVGATQRLRVGTAILIVPQRNPVVLAQEIVALDHLSAGRFDLGVGIGWSWEEFAALGVPWPRRGARTDEYLDAMGVLWRDPRCTFDGEFVSFADVIAEPKPVQSPRPPIWIGGGDAAMTRAARRGDGWFGWSVAPRDYATTKAALDRACTAVDRDPSTLRSRIGVVGASGDALRAHTDAAAACGVDEIVVAAGPGADLMRSQIDALAALRA